MICLADSPAIHSVAFYYVGTFDPAIALIPTPIENPRLANVYWIRSRDHTNLPIISTYAHRSLQQLSAIGCLSIVSRSQKLGVTQFALIL